MAIELSVLGAVGVGVWSRKYVGTSGPVLRFSGVPDGLMIYPEGAFIPYCVVFCNVVLGSIVELLRLCFEL